MQKFESRYDEGSNNIFSPTFIYIYICWSIYVYMQCYVFYSDLSNVVHNAIVNILMYMPAVIIKKLQGNFNGIKTNQIFTTAHTYLVETRKDFYLIWNQCLVVCSPADPAFFRLKHKTEGVWHHRLSGKFHCTPYVRHTVTLLKMNTWQSQFRLASGIHMSFTWQHIC